MFDNQKSALNDLKRVDNSMETEYSAPVITVETESSIHDALLQIQTNFIKRVVVTKDDKPVGVVTERDINKFLEQDKTAKALNEIPIKYVMKKNVIALQDTVDDKLIQSAARMTTFKIGSVILVDTKGNLSGIITKTDITKAYSIIHAGKYKVKDYMTRKLITCRKTDSLKFVLNMMNKNDISRIIVTNNYGQPLGIITTNTFLTHSDYFSDGHTRSRDYLLPLKSKKLHVGDLLEDKLVTVQDEEDLAKAANLMIKNKISGIPVLDQDKNLVGVIDKSDIVRAFNDVKTHQRLSEEYGYLH
jgi:predicted transcriptional regulator